MIKEALMSFIAATAATSTYQHRIAIARDIGMNIAFNTLGNAMLEGSPKVFYGLSPDSLIAQANGTSSSYATARSTTHKVPLRNLEPDTQYYYQSCLDVDGTCKRSPTYSFRTTVSPGDNRELKFAALGDMGVMGPLGLSTDAPKSVEDFARLDEGERSTMKALIDNQHKYLFIYQNGDFAHADDVGRIVSGYLNSILDVSLFQQMSETYELILETFFNQTSQFSKGTPYMAGIGNHEQLLTKGNTYTDPETNHTIMVDNIPQGQRKFTFFKDKFYMNDIKNGVPPPGTSRDPEQEDLGEPNEQLEWLEGELGNFNRGVTPWIIVCGHRPWYGTYRGCPGCMEVFDPLFVKYGVELVYHGHIHFYERLAPMVNDNVDPKELGNPKAPWYIVSGAAGHYDGLDAMADSISDESRRLIQGAFGYDEFTIHNRIHMTHAFIASKNDTVLDQQTLYKAHDEFGSEF
ncbi:putative purple acid phosphatase 20 [Wallemia ichthyophaga EXF-994]|uniref:Purple acid phosphatase n=1 Tax=Wallemia ichthyophaga (strain EXF-994 / CBS 113033) TaxID=1299270 RepID=R9A9E9_WALI9|nr:putative purple acid phosphatase 20 [Wallemia ichthyophaga EXF-994]EOQ98742.1 putative purple acid phosphatase 20 [Wallemia ichthyophaga EXF-994]